MIRACFFGTYNATHPSNRLLADALSRAGCAVSVCHEPLWERTRDKMASFFGPLSLGRLGFAYLGAARRLAARWRALPTPDLVVTGFNGQLDVLLVRLIAGRRVPLVFAPLVTLTETLVDDRAVYGPGGAKARLARALDRLTLETPDLVLLDSDAHRDYVAERLGTRARTATWYLGAEPVFAAAPPPARRAGEPLRVLFYGQYLPLHGAEVIVAAAARLGPRAGVELTMIGTGPERAAVEQLARTHACTHVCFEDWVPYESLPARLAASDVALGIFGATPKAAIVIPTKIYQAAAVGRAIVTGDSPAVRELFTPGESVLAVRAGDPAALTDALVRLRESPEETARLGAGAARVARERLAADTRAALLGRVLGAAFPALAARLAPAPTRSLRGAAAGS